MANQSNINIKTDDAIHALLNGNTLSGCHLSDAEEYDKYQKGLSILQKPALLLEDPCLTHDVLNKIWFIPDEYKEFDIETFLFERCTTDEQKERVQQELELYKEHDLIRILQLLKYLVDYMRQHDIVWGVGRGSSVSSYCLYLLGVHKIDSIRYNLSIEEFLK